MLNKEQEIFLQRYINRKGDVYGVLDSMGLESHHLMMWREIKEFELRYKDTQRKLIQFLNSENYITGLRRLNEILDSGVSDEIITRKERVLRNPKFDPEKNPHEPPVIQEYEVSQKIVKKGIPPQMIQLALQQNTIIQAINVLTNQGIIPENIARKILSKSEDISKEMQSAFDVDSSKEEIMTQSKAVNLMKQAILKGVNDD